MIEARELSEALVERQQSSKVLDQWGAQRAYYLDWHREISEVYKLYAGQYDVLWPDAKRSRALPKIPNFVQIAADDRARAVASGRASIVCRPDKQGDKATEAANKRERILGGYWQSSRVRGKVSRWALDAMASGLMVCKVWMDTSIPKAERFPQYSRLSPQFAYPDPIFADGPFVDSMIYAYEEKVRTVEARYGVQLTSKSGRNAFNADKCRVIEFYDEDWVVIAAESMSNRNQNSPNAEHEILLAERHNLGITPVTIGARPTLDGVYRSEFLGGMGVINYWNKMMTLTLDDAINKVYAPKVATEGVQNPNDWGPDALILLDTPNDKMEYVVPPSAPFSNLQLMHDLGGFARASVLLPPSRSGDPNESIISAAGVNATQTQFNEDVKSLQTDLLAPMLEAGNEVAFRWDSSFADVPKTIYGESNGQMYRETYTPSKDIDGNYRSTVAYGVTAGLDPVNANVLTLQQWNGGNGLITRRTAMEQSPFVEDPQREEKGLAAEQIDQAVFAGLVQQAQSGALDSVTLAKIRKALDDDNMSLHDAIIANTAQAPMAPPQGAAPTGGPPGSPGLPGAAEGGAQAVPPTGGQLPPLTQLLGGLPPPGRGGK